MPANAMTARSCRLFMVAHVLHVQLPELRYIQALPTVLLVVKYVILGACLGTPWQRPPVYQQMQVVVLTILDHPVRHKVQVG